MREFNKTLEKWRNMFRTPLAVRWGKHCLENAYCAQCRFCCGPQGSDAPFPMALLPDQCGPENVTDFYMLNENTAYIGAEGCKSDSPTGCRLPFDKRPLACGLFPIVLANGKLYLYQNCPASLLNPPALFMEMAAKAASMLGRLSIEELRHISINLGNDVLAEKYIDLHQTIFDGKGKLPQGRMAD